MRTKRTKEYIEATAHEHGVRPNQVKEIADSMFEFVAEIMAEGDRQGLNFAEIRLMKWGVFKVKEGRRKHFEKINKGNKAANGGS
jgi:nucleoid DNA-binding protein